MNRLHDYDIIIAGGGLVGASLACAVGPENCRIAVVEPVSFRQPDQPSYDDRGLALSWSTIQILHGLGIWQSVRDSANPIKHIHVSNQNHFGFVHLHAESVNVRSLGYVVIARDLGRALLNEIESRQNIDFICPASVQDIKMQADYAQVSISRNNNTEVLNSKLVVIADGTQSKLRERLGMETETHDFQQTAIVTNVTPGRPHQDTAYERFTSHGPLAVLPLTKNRCAVVFTVVTGDTEKYLDCDDKFFLQSLQDRFGYRLGRFQHVGTRKSYPIKKIELKNPVQDRAIFLGNAAHTLHPNGAQGFNLGLRDVAGLAELLVPAIRNGKDPGDYLLLDNYLDLREHDQKRVMCFTDGLASLFYNDLPHKVLARNAGMLITNIFPPLKKAIMRGAMGLHGKQPALVRGVPL